MNNEFENQEDKVVEAQAQPQKQSTGQKFGNPIILLSTIAAFALMFLNGFLMRVVQSADAIRTLGTIFYVLIFGCIAVAFTFILLNFRKTGKSIFSLETILALIALIVFFI
ncbi:MAG: hypothetical protein LBN07_04070 [Christensenellaceae bacterium]|jgi:hypothetical protein|nr:hypothetical protein [Christensenellaceae bacterium]